MVHVSIKSTRNGIEKSFLAEAILGICNDSQLAFRVPSGLRTSIENESLIVENFYINHWLKKQMFNAAKFFSNLAEQPSFAPVGCEAAIRSCACFFCDLGKNIRGSFRYRIVFFCLKILKHPHFRKSVCQFQNKCSIP